MFSIPETCPRRSSYGRPGHAHRLWPLSAVGLMVIVVCTPGQTLRADADSDYNLAVELYKQERWPLAEETFRKFIAAYPDHSKTANARLYRGLVLVNLNDFKTARDVFRAYVIDYPESRNRNHATYRIGEASYFLDDLPAAETEFIRFAKDYPKDPLLDRALPYLADTQLRQKKYEAAATTFQRSLQLHPQGALVGDVRFGLARALQLQGKGPAAATAFKAIADDTDNPRAGEATFSLAAMSFDAEEYAEAARLYAKLVKDFPQHSLAPSAALNAGFANYRLREFDVALSQFETAAAEPETAVQARYWRGITLKSLDRHADAVTALEEARKLADETELAESIRYQLADAYRQTGRTDDALKEFLAVAETWPQSESADDSIYAAAELAFDAGDLKTTETLLGRMRTDYAESGLRMYRDILQSRLLLASGADPAEALRLLEQVVKDSTVDQTRRQAGYYLAVALKQAGRNQDALQALEPLVTAIQSGEADEPAEALVLQTLLFVEEDRYADAVAAGNEYLSRYPAGVDRPKMWAAVAVARAGLNDRPQADAALAELTEAAPESPLLVETLRPMAEAAFSAKAFDWSEQLFGSLLDAADTDDDRAVALSGRAWSRFEGEQYAAAAIDFADIVARFPDSEYAAEAALMSGRALERKAAFPEAAQAYRATFDTFAPTTPVPQGIGDPRSPTAYAFQAGRDAIRMLRRLGEIQTAEAVFAQLFRTFPNPPEADALLDDWAVMHYEAGNFERADEIFTRLVKEHPASPLADNARLSLAESTLVAGNIDQARREFQTLAADTTADDVVKSRSLYQLLLIDMEQESWSEVRDDAERLVKAYPQTEYADQAILYAAEAELHLNRLGPQSIAPIVETLGQLQAKQDALGDQEWFPRVWVLMAELEFRRKQYDRVTELAAEMREKFPESKFGYQAEEVAGRALKQQAKFDAARETLKHVVADEHGAKTETAAKSQILIAETYFLQENYAQALIEYQRAYSDYQFPLWQSAALLQAAQCDEQLGADAVAMKTYQKLIAEFPQSPYVVEARQRIEVLKSKGTTGT